MPIPSPLAATEDISPPPPPTPTAVGARGDTLPSGTAEEDDEEEDEAEDDDDDEEEEEEEEEGPGKPTPFDIPAALTAPPLSPMQ